MIDIKTPESKSIDRGDTTVADRKLNNPFPAPTNRSPIPLTEAIHRAAELKRQKAGKPTFERAETLKDLEYQNKLITAKQIESEKAGLKDEARVFKTLADEAEQRAREAEALSMIDPLTGLHNYRWMESEFDKESAEADRDGSELNFLELDFDRFKKINDAYGQGGGDKALQAVRELQMRRNTPIARLGGDEFGILLKGKITREDATAISQRMVEEMRTASRDVIAGLQVVDTAKPDEVPTEFTLCVGIAPYQKGDTLETLKARADIGLKNAKLDPDKGTGYLIEMRDGVPTPVPLK